MPAVGAWLAGRYRNRQRPPAGKVIGEGNMRKLLLVPACFVLLIITGDVTSAAPCMPFVRTFHGQTVDGYMTVRSGKRCNLTFRSSGPTETTHIVQRPSSGSASVGAGGRVTYQARAGYVGGDTFVYQRRGQNTAGGPSIKTVRVNVTVRP
jgi:hypothetical protein